MSKRARERTRQEKQEAKRQKKEDRVEEAALVEAPDETALMEEFRALSEQYNANVVSESHYNSERHRIFVALGIETEADG
jgi:hypothetical protein